MPARAAAFGDALARQPPRQAVQVGMEAQVARHAQVQVERHLLEHHADVAQRAHGRAAQRVAGHLDLALVGGEQAGQHLEQRGLAGAVGPEQRDELPGRQRQRQTGQGRAVAVALIAVAFDQDGVPRAALYGPRRWRCRPVYNTASRVAGRSPCRFAEASDPATQRSISVPVGGRRPNSHLVARRPPVRHRHQQFDGRRPSSCASGVADRCRRRARVVDLPVAEQQAVGLRIQSSGLRPGRCRLPGAEQALAGDQVAHRQRDAVAHQWLVVRGMRRRRHLRGQRGELERGHALDPERRHWPVAGHRHHVPVHAAVVLQHRQHRQRGGQVLEHRGCGVELDPAAVAQAQQAAHVLDLRVGQHHRAHGGVEQRRVGRSSRASVPTAARATAGDTLISTQCLVARQRRPPRRAASRPWPWPGRAGRLPGARPRRRP